MTAYDLCSLGAAFCNEAAYGLCSDFALGTTFGSDTASDLRFAFHLETACALRFYLDFETAYDLFFALVAVDAFVPSLGLATLRRRLDILR